MSARTIFFRSKAWPASLACALALAAVWPLAAQAQWKWREGGRVQYSDRPPPPSVQEKDIIARPSGAVRRAAPEPVAAPASSASAASPVAAASAVDPKLEARRREAEQKAEAEKKAREDKAAAERRENCQRARDYARTLDSGMRVGRVNDRGEREVLDDTQRAAEVARTQQVIASECGN